jgi:phage terminase large subunit GpA-like protein
MSEPLFFSPRTKFEQTCGHCGCVFLVEIERAASFRDVQEYSCPDCHHHTCLTKTSTPPRLTVISRPGT